MDEDLIRQLIAATQAGAIGAAAWNGRGERKKADKAAVEAMRIAFNAVAFSGTVVIGEGERDEAPMLYIGEQVGSGGPAIDIAIDPLEGTNLCARNEPNAISVMAVGPSGTLLHAPDTYMDKIGVGPKCKGKIDLDWPVERNVRAVADALGKPLEEVTVLVMDRERHEKLIAELRRLNCRVKLIRDGDISGGILPAIEGSGVDLLLGIGAAPEGVIAAAALKSLGGDFQGRLKFEGQELLERAEGDAAFLERAKNAQEEFLRRAQKMGLADPHKKFFMDELVQDGAAFICTGVTDGELVRGVRREGDYFLTESMLIFNGKMEKISGKTQA